MDNLVWWVMISLNFLSGIATAYEAGKGEQDKIIGAVFKIGIAIWGLLTLVR